LISKVEGRRETAVLMHRAGAYSVHPCMVAMHRAVHLPVRSGVFSTA